MSSNSVPGTNLNQVYSPELWAMESLAILFENAVAAMLVNRDFENHFANFGDVVNTRKPSSAQAHRKAPGDPIVKQQPTSTNIPVKLNQHIESSFELTDEETAKSFKNLREEFLVPHAISMATTIDRIVLGQYVHFMANQAGTLGGLTTASAVSLISDGGLVMTRNKAPMSGRRIIWTPEAEALIIQNSVFHEADKRGDTAGLIEASLGRKLKFDHWMDQNMSQIPVHGTLVTETINNGNVARGSTVLTIDAASAAIPQGSWLTINGRVYQAAATTNSSGTTLTLTYGLLEAIEDGDDVVVQPCTNAFDAAYSTDYAGWIAIDNGSGADPATISPGMILSDGLNNYVVIDVNDDPTTANQHEVLLDRPLEADIADGDIAAYGPGGGGLNFAFNPDALTLAIRPLQAPQSGAGAIGGTANFNGLTMRSVLSYDSTKQTHIVTLDFLAGVKVLEPLKGAVVLS
jgi:hypothetical protein